MNWKKSALGTGRIRSFPGTALLLILLLCLTAVCTLAGTAGARPTVALTILHVNDTHGHILPGVVKTVDPERPVGGAAWLAQMIEDERAKNPQGTLLLSGGDMFQGTAISNVFRGAPVTEIMNALAFDAMAVGNHEFDWGMDTLRKLRTAARTPWLAANIVDGQGKGLPGVKPWIIAERKGIRIAVIGITTPETAWTTKPGNVAGLTFREPKDVLPGLIRQVRAEGARLVVVLSHCGLDADRKTAGEVEGIDVIVGGHSHTAVMDPVVVGKTVIVQAGCYGQYLGVLELQVDPEEGRITGFTEKNELKAVYSGPKDSFDPAIAAIVASYDDRIRDRFAAVVGSTEVDLTRNYRGESNLGDLIADAMREAAGADIALMNSGGIRTDISRGAVTLEILYTLLPFDNLLVSMDLTGRQVLQILEESARGSRGSLQISGLRVTADLTRPAGQRIVGVEIDGRPLAAEKTYRVVTNDFLAAGGDEFTVFREGKNVVYGDDLRDVAAAYLKKHSPVRPRIEGRIEVRGI
ncbi:MAG: bifunctional metallophosphatase/5'-nucleotidase [Syntrophaceae bacterium]|nr:bifunctional metallophosphatase/5'-nucleotidase [Syntrophaceae bacterium]